MYLISQQTNQEFITLFFIKKARFPNYSRRVKINFNLSDEVLRQAHFFYLSHSVASEPGADPGFFFRRGWTRLLLYFNTNKPHSFFFFLQITSCIRKPQVISGGGGCPPPAPSPPQIHPWNFMLKPFNTKYLIIYSSPIYSCLGLDIGRMICVLSVNRSRKRLTISFVAVLIHSLSGKSLNYHYLLLSKQQVQLGYFDWGFKNWSPY